jgi:hypothetical protein
VYAFEVAFEFFANGGQACPQKDRVG